MNRLTVAVLRVLLVILFLGAFSTQLWYIPWTAEFGVRAFPELHYLVVPYSALCVAAVACVQLVFVALWVLLSKVRRGRIFTDSAFGWVNAIIAAGAVATAIMAGIEIHLLAYVNEGGPGVVVLLAAMVVAGTAITLVMVVMRGLLLQATQLQSELEEVV